MHVDAGIDDISEEEYNRLKEESMAKKKKKNKKKDKKKSKVDEKSKVDHDKLKEFFRNLKEPSSP